MKIYKCVLWEDVPQRFQDTPSTLFRECAVISVDFLWEESDSLIDAGSKDLSDEYRQLAMWMRSKKIDFLINQET